MSVLLEKTPLVKFTRNQHLGLEWCIFHILTSEDIDDFTDIKFVSLIVLKVSMTDFFLFSCYILLEVLIFFP